MAVAKFTEMQEFFIKGNYRVLSPSEIAAKIGVTARRVETYVKKLPVLAEEKTVVAPKRNDHFERLNGSVCMTGAQATVNDEIEKNTKPGENNLFNSKVKNCIYVPEPDKPSY